ncbi:hypothetical protein [Naasia aerilata]|uniref:Uncharacterized protein n=1 Tax=Naasia aerilata TaxID=1162966 RepID=A0ABM8G9N9_9MICO|nr:hypothetical protein [Naasia aerilata]BDZ44913.1 hypothetical protein GCM10025866_08220 [Naasia aerilata]
MLKPAYPENLSEVDAQLLDLGQWRLVNSTLDRADAASVLGFVQKVGSAYEVLELERPLSPTRVRSLREARALLVGPRRGHE